MKNEKRVKFIKKGGATIAFLVLALVSLGGCVEEVALATPTDTPKTTQQVIEQKTPISTVTPSLEPTATPTVRPELTYDQKKLIIGMTGDKDPVKPVDVVCYRMEINGKTYRVFAYTMISTDPSKAGILKIYNALNDVHMFTLQCTPEQYKNAGTYYECLKEYNPPLSDLKLTDSYPLFNLAEHYKAWGIDYKNNEILNEFINIIYNGTEEEMNKLWKSTYTKEQLLDLYINSTPEDEILPFWYYTPNTKMPDELRGIYSDLTYSTPTPTNTQQQSSKADPNIISGHNSFSYLKQKNTGVKYEILGKNSYGGHQLKRTS